MLGASVFQRKRWPPNTHDGPGPSDHPYGNWHCARLEDPVWLLSGQWKAKRLISIVVHVVLERKFQSIQTESKKGVERTTIDHIYQKEAMEERQEPRLGINRKGICMDLLLKSSRRTGVEYEPLVAK